MRRVPLIQITQYVYYFTLTTTLKFLKSIELDLILITFLKKSFYWCSLTITYQISFDIFFFCYLDVSVHKTIALNKYLKLSLIEKVSFLEILAHSSLRNVAWLNRFVLWTSLIFKT